MGWGFGSGWLCWDVLVSLLGVSGCVFVDLGYAGVVVVVFWSVELCLWVDVGVCLCCYSVGV